MFNLKRRRLELLVVVGWGACLVHITSASGNQRHDELIAELRQAYERPIDHDAAVSAKQGLAELIRNGNVAAANACAGVLDEMRVQPESWWQELSKDQFISKTLLQTSLEHFSFICSDCADDSSARMAGEPRHEAVFDGFAGAGGGRV